MTTADFIQLLRQADESNPIQPDEPNDDIWEAITEFVPLPPDVIEGAGADLVQKVVSAYKQLQESDSPEKESYLQEILNDFLNQYQELPPDQQQIAEDVLKEYQGDYPEIVPAFNQALTDFIKQMQPIEQPVQPVQQVQQVQQEQPIQPEMPAVVRTYSTNILNALSQLEEKNPEQIRDILANKLNDIFNHALREEERQEYFQIYTDIMNNVLANFPDLQNQVDVGQIWNGELEVREKGLQLAGDLAASLKEGLKAGGTAYDLQSIILDKLMPLIEEYSKGDEKQKREILSAYNALRYAFPSVYGDAVTAKTLTSVIENIWKEGQEWLSPTPWVNIIKSQIGAEDLVNYDRIVNIFERNATRFLKSNLPFLRTPEQRKAFIDSFLNSVSTTPYIRDLVKEELYDWLDDLEREKPEPGTPEYDAAEGLGGLKQDALGRASEYTAIPARFDKAFISFLSQLPRQVDVDTAANEYKERWLSALEEAIPTENTTAATYNKAVLNWLQKQIDNVYNKRLSEYKQRPETVTPAWYGALAVGSFEKDAFGDVTTKPEVVADRFEKGLTAYWNEFTREQRDEYYNAFVNQLKSELGEAAQGYVKEVDKRYEELKRSKGTGKVIGPTDPTIRAIEGYIDKGNFPGLASFWIRYDASNASPQEKQQVWDTIVGHSLVDSINTNMEALMNQLDAGEVPDEIKDIINTNAVKVDDAQVVGKEGNQWKVLVKSGDSEYLFNIRFELYKGNEQIGIHYSDIDTADFVRREYYRNKVVNKVFSELADKDPETWQGEDWYAFGDQLVGLIKKSYEGSKKSEDFINKLTAQQLVALTRNMPKDAYTTFVGYLPPEIAAYMPYRSSTLTSLLFEWLDRKGTAASRAEIEKRMRAGTTPTPPPSTQPPPTAGTPPSTQPPATGTPPSTQPPVKGTIEVKYDDEKGYVLDLSKKDELILKDGRTVTPLSTYVDPLGFLLVADENGNRDVINLKDIEHVLKKGKRYYSLEMPQTLPDYVTSAKNVLSNPEEFSRFDPDTQNQIIDILIDNIALKLFSKLNVDELKGLRDMYKNRNWTGFYDFFDSKINEVVKRDPEYAELDKLLKGLPIFPSDIGDRVVEYIKKMGIPKKGSIVTAQEYYSSYPEGMGAELSPNIFTSRSPVLFPYKAGEECTLEELDFPIVAHYLNQVASDNYGIENFTQKVSEGENRKTICFVYNSTFPHAKWVDDQHLHVNLYRVKDLADLLGVLVHEFRHVLTVMTNEPSSDLQERVNASPSEYVKLPEENIAFPEMISFMLYTLRLPKDVVRDKIISIIGEENTYKVDEWFKQLGIEKSAGFPSHPKNIVIPRNEYYPKGLTEEDVWNYYNSVRNKILPYLKGQPVMLVLNADGEVYKRHDKDPESFIDINTEKEFDRFNNGRVLEFHKVLEDTSNYGFVDVDPREDVPFDKVKEVTGMLYDLLSSLPEVEEVDLIYSGGRGFHLYPKYRSYKDVDGLRRELRDILEAFANSVDANLTTHRTTSSDQIRLDVSTLKSTGSLRAVYSLNGRTGLRCIPVSRRDLDDFEKEDAKIKTGIKTAQDTGQGVFVPTTSESLGEYTSSIQEVLLMAISDECHAIATYSAMIDALPEDDTNRSILEELKFDEQVHERVLLRMLGRELPIKETPIAEETLPPVRFRPDYNDLEERGKFFAKFIDLVSVAIADERHAISFYDTILDGMNVTDPNYRVIEKIMRDEQDHERKLLNMLGEEVPTLD